MLGCLPAELFRKQLELLVWQDKQFCTRKDLEYLIDVLWFPPKVVSQSPTPTYMADDKPLHG